MADLNFSIAICCYNSAERIARTLQAAFNLRIPEDTQVEILLINNNSTDRTAEVALATSADFHSSSILFRMVNEPTPGQMYARKRAIKEARFELILFCDDDNSLQQDYLVNAHNIFREHASVGIAGGYNKPGFDVESLPWIKEFLSAIAVGTPFNEEKLTTWVYGAGMVIRKEIFSLLEERNITLELSGRKGGKQSSGDDAEICVLTRFLGFEILLSPKLVLTHYVDVSRLRRGFFLRLNVENFYPTVYLFLLDKMVLTKTIKLRPQIFSFMKARVLRAGKALVRLILLRKPFFNLVEFYSNLMIAFWVLWNYDRVKQIPSTISKNLYEGHKSV